MEVLRHAGTVFSLKNQTKDSWAAQCLRVPGKQNVTSCSVMVSSEVFVQAQGWNRGWTEKMIDWTT